MCSIIGYSGNEIAAPIIVKGLKRMEYRGYDSVGVATESENQIGLKKGTGKVTEVNSKFQLDTLPGRIGIGHTRWATHGKVTDLNAHPHPSNSGKIAIVHNGIIENFEELKKFENHYEIQIIEHTTHRQLHDKNNHTGPSSFPKPVSTHLLPEPRRVSLPPKELRSISRR